MKKQETKTVLQDLLLIRNEAVKIGEDIKFASKVKQDLTLKLINIQHCCNHNIVVRFRTNERGREARCLCCNKAFYGSMVGADFYFENIIDMQALETDEDKVTLALGMFAQTKTLNPNMSDKQIVEIINNKINENKVFTEKSGFVKTKGKKQI